MPMIAIDYAKTIIYKIVCNDLNITDCYVGHTTSFTKRKAQHKFESVYEKGKGYNKKLYKTIRQNGGFCNYSMLEIEKCPCKDVFEACKRERFHFEQLNSTLNTNIPGRTTIPLYKDIEKRKLYQKNWLRQKVINKKGHTSF